MKIFNKKRLVIILMIICLFPFLTSCKEMKLEKAFNRLSKTSYTMQGFMDMEFEMSFMGQTSKQTMSAYLLIESSPTEAYSETKMNGSYQDSYMIVNEDDPNKVTVYTNDGWSWEKEEKTLNEYQSESDSFFLDIDTEDVFTLEDGIWVGDTELIKSMLSDYMDEMSEELAGDDASLIAYNINKYNIEMTGKNISKIDIEMTMVMNAGGILITVRMKMPMQISDVGSTEVTVPEGLPF